MDLKPRYLASLVAMNVVKETRTCSGTLQVEYDGELVVPFRTLRVLTSRMHWMIAVRPLYFIGTRRSII